MIRAFLIMVVLCALVPLQVAAVAAEDTAGQEKNEETFGLKLAPLEYRTQLEAGGEKKGFVDVSNPTDQSQTITTSVQGFRQIADDGSLEFFDEEQISEGVKLDLESFELPAKSAIRVFFLIDGTKLPSGEVYAALFFSTTAADDADKTNVQPAVRVGTLLSITNGTPGERAADVTGLSVPLLQFGDIRGSYSLKNNADPNESTGFYPDVTLSIDPLHREQKQQASLLFAGRERSTPFTIGQRFPGVYRLQIDAGGAAATRYVIVVTPLAGGIALLLVLLGAGFYGYRRTSGRKRPRRRKRKRRS